MLTLASPNLLGPRVSLRLPAESEAALLLEFYERNRERLELSGPARDDQFYTRPFWIRRIADWNAEFEQGRSAHLAVFLHSWPGAVAGRVSLSVIQRGPAQLCYLGYAIDGRCEGHGLMTEAVGLAVDFAFSQLNLHRVQAAYMPTNERSGRLLRRLGFVVEGFARDYLFIGGAWRDHILTSRINPNWRA